MECNHERKEEMRGIIFCTSCGEEIERFFGFFKNFNVKQKPKTKLQKEMESYGFPKDVTKEAFRLYKKFYDKPIRKTIAFGCFYVAWKGEVNEDEILGKMKLNKKVGRKELVKVTEKIKNGSW